MCINLGGGGMLCLWFVVLWSAIAFDRERDEVGSNIFSDHWIHIRSDETREFREIDILWLHKHV
jgi:hypothetical protein